jgi:hypothetical protein
MAFVKLGAHKKEKETEIGCTENIFCWSKYDTYNLKQVDRVKNDVHELNLHRNLFCRSECDTHNSKQENRVKTT